MTVHIVEADDNATGYDTPALAMADLSDESNSRACMGFVTAINTSGTFVPGTTELDASGVTTTYTDGFISSRNIPKAVLLEDDVLYVRPKPHDIFSFQVYAKQKPSAMSAGETPLVVDWGPMIALGTAIEIITADLGYDEDKVTKLKNLYDYQRMLVNRRFAAQFYSGRQTAQPAF